MIEYLLDFLGIDSALVSTDFQLFAGTLIVVGASFVIAKTFFSIAKGFFGRY